MAKFGADAIEMKLDSKKKLDPIENREGESPDSNKKTTTVIKTPEKSKAGRMLFFGFVGVIAIVGTIVYMQFFAGPLINMIYPFENKDGFIFFTLKVMSSFPVLGILLYSIFSGFKSTFETDNIVRAVAICVLFTQAVIIFGYVSNRMNDKNVPADKQQSQNSSQEKVDEIVVRIFTFGPFTKADTNKKGYITVYETGKGKVEVGDKIEVIATLADGSPYMGNKVKFATKNKWEPLKEGLGECWVGRVDPGFFVYIKEIEKIDIIVKISGKRKV